MATHHPDHPFYMPIIKWQQWEQKALANLGHIKSEILPCIEVRDSSQHANLLTNFAKVWSTQALIDYANPSGVLTGQRRVELSTFLRKAHQESYPVIPVVNPLDIETLQVPTFMSLIQKFGEVAFRVRLDRYDMSDEDYLNIHDAQQTLKEANCDSILLVDLGVTPNSWSKDNILMLLGTIRRLKLLSFKTLHFASGAFPESLASVKTGHATFARNDWMLWKALNVAEPSLRLGYSDYGVLSPNWTEEVLIRMSQKVAIRYATENEWLILRADAKTTEESIAISQILVTAHQQSFKGASYSFGDKLIADRADPSIPESLKKCGHYHITEAWSHHISFVVKDQY
jgi:hypothetical protein